jgi:hypothetical protein
MYRLVELVMALVCFQYVVTSFVQEGDGHRSILQLPCDLVFG